MSGDPPVHASPSSRPDATEETHAASAAPSPRALRATLMFPPALDDTGEKVAMPRAEVAPAEASEGALAPDAPQSDRPTVRALPIATPTVAAPMAPPTMPFEVLSTSWLVEVDATGPEGEGLPSSELPAVTTPRLVRGRVTQTEPAPAAPGDPDDRSSRAIASTDRPTPPVVVQAAPRRSHRRALGQGPLAAAAAFVAVAAAGVVAWKGSAADRNATSVAVAASHEASTVHAAEEASQRRWLAADRVGLATAPVSAWDGAAPPAGACRIERGPVVVAARTRLATATSSLALPRGFVVAHAPAAGEVEAVRLDLTTLGIAERARTRELGLAGPGDEIARALAEAGPEGTSFYARAAGRARTMVFPDDGEAFAIELAGGAVTTRRAWAATPRTVWWLSRTAATAAAPVRSRPGPAAAATVAPASHVAVPFARAAPVTDGWLAAAARDEGGAVVALRYGGAVKVGAVDASFGPEGPLVTVTAPRTRPAAAARGVGVPVVIAHGTGAVVAWSEREDDGTTRVHAAAVARDGAVSTHDLGPGSAPALAELADGDVLVALSTGAAGARRVSVVRLAPDLAARGTVLVVSRDGDDADQPTLAVRGDGRAIVTFTVAADAATGRLFAAPITCDPGL